MDNVTICPFYNNSQILSCTLILFTIFFSRGFIKNPFQPLSGEREVVQPGQDAHALRHIRPGFE